LQKGGLSAALFILGDGLILETAPRSLIFLIGDAIMVSSIVIVALRDLRRRNRISAAGFAR
jgi:hypothetical protein